MTSQMKESKKILLSLLNFVRTVEEQTKLIHRKKTVNFNILGIYNMYFKYDIEVAIIIVSFV